MLDEIVGIGISVAESKMHGEAKEEKKSFGYHFLRFIISTIWFIVAVGALILGLMAMVGHAFTDNAGLAVVALILTGGFALITFLVPYLRKKGSATRWYGIVCFGEFLWWIYLLSTGL